MRKTLLGLRSLLCATRILSPSPPFKDFSSDYKIVVLESQKFLSNPAYATEHHRYRKMLGYVSWVSQTVSKPLLTIFHVPISLLYAAVNAKT